MSILFTSDTHFSHANIIIYTSRPWKESGDTVGVGRDEQWVSKSIAKIRSEAMNECLISNWNTVVHPNDDIYHLGDFGFGDISEVLRRLNGKIHMIVGSHDKQIWDHKDKFVEIGHIFDIKIEGQHITLCHYSMRSWSRSFHGSWHLFGHSHGRLESLGKSFDVGVDSHNFYPWSFYEVKEKMSSLGELGV